MFDYFLRQNQNNQNESSNQIYLLEDEIKSNPFYTNESYRQLNQSNNIIQSFSNFEKGNESENNSSLFSKNESQFSNYSQSLFNSEKKSEKINNSSLFSKDEVSEINRFNNNSQSSVNSEESDETRNILNFFNFEPHVSKIKLFINKKSNNINYLNYIKMEQDKNNTILNNVPDSNNSSKLQEFNQKNKENSNGTENNVRTKIKKNLAKIKKKKSRKDKLFKKIEKLKKTNIQCFGKETEKYKNNDFVILFLIMMYNYNMNFVEKFIKKRRTPNFKSYLIYFVW